VPTAEEERVRVFVPLVHRYNDQKAEATRIEKSTVVRIWWPPVAAVGVETRLGFFFVGTRTVLKAGCRPSVNISILEPCPVEGSYSR
jgi:hypothetical protein